MKKLFVLLLGGAMALSLAACGGAGTPSSAGTNAMPDAPQATQAPGQKSTFQATIEPTVLVDEQGVKVTASELSYTDSSVVLDLVLENDSGEDLSFYSGTLGFSRNSVNGYMVEGLYVNADVPAGKKSNETINISQDDLLAYGITDIADIEMAFEIKDSGYDDYLRTEPSQINTSLAGSYDYAADTYQAAMGSGDFVAAYGGTLEHFATDEVFNEQGVRIVSELFLTNGYGEPALLVELENTSDQMVTAYTKDVCVNGLQLQSGSWNADDINAGKRRLLTLQPYDMLDPAYWEAYGLGAVGEISFTLSLKDASGSALCEDAAITLTVPGAEAAFCSDGDPVYSDKGVRILKMGLVPDAMDGNGDVHLLLLAENGTGNVVAFDVGYDTLSVNGYMTDFFCIGPTLAPGKSGVLDVELSSDSLEKNGIGSAEDIKRIDLTFELHDDDYNELASPTVTIGEGGQPAEDADVTADEAAAAAEPDADTQGADVSGVSPDFKELMDSYEAFFDEYATFMENYQSSTNTASMLMDYLSFMTRYVETMEKLDGIDTQDLSAADEAYYLQVMARITARLAGVMA